MARSMLGVTKARLVALALGLMVAACDDASRCSEARAARCADEHTLEVCDGAGGDLRWTRGACPTDTPVCAEQGASAAVCVTELTGSCDADHFETQCLDEHTLDDCVRYREGASEGARQRVRCREGEVCGEVPPDTLLAGRPVGATHACYAPRPREAPPALVAFLVGGATVAGRPAPEVPFRVMPGEHLVLEAGARAVVLVKERASRLSGPSDTDPYVLQPQRNVPSEEARALVEILAGEPPPPAIAEAALYDPAPSTRDVVRLTVGEGMPGASSTIRRFAWRCGDDEGCGRTVELRRVAPEQGVLFRGNGARELAYEGPGLEAGARYELSIGEHRYRVETLPVISLRELMASIAEFPVVEQLAVLAAVHLYRGSRAAAVEVLQRGLMDRRRDPELLRLIEIYRGPT
ncbi:MAG: hypothetical protein AB7S26_28610 [Sandaracinaceae bacterium]